MENTQPNIPEMLRKENSEIAMVYQRATLRESISLGPTFPANKYKPYEDFIFGHPKAGYFPVLSLIEPSGYGKTHFMIHCAKENKLVIPIGELFRKASKLRLDMLQLLKTGAARSEVEEVLKRFLLIVLETFVELSHGIDQGKFAALLLFNGIMETISFHIYEKYNQGYMPLSISSQNVLWFVDEAHEISLIFPNLVPRSSPNQPMGNANTLLAAACRELGPVVLMSTKASFANYIDSISGAESGITETSESLKASLPPLTYGTNIDYVKYFIKTENIPQHEVELIKLLLQGNIRRLEVLLKEICSSSNQNQCIFDSFLNIKQLIRKAAANIFENAKLGEEKDIFGYVRTKLDSIPHVHLILSEMLIVYGKLEFGKPCKTNTDSELIRLEQYLRNHGIGYVKENETTLYYRDLVFSAQYQKLYSSMGKILDMISNWLLEYPKLVKSEEIYGIDASHLLRMFIGYLLCTNANMFGYRAKTGIFMRDFKPESNCSNKNSQITSLFLSDINQNFHMECKNFNSIVALPADSNDPDLVTILHNEESKNSELCTASITLTNIKHQKDIVNKICNDYMKTKRFLFWNNKSSELILKRDREFIVSELNQIAQVKLVRLLFFANITIKQVKKVFDAQDLKEVCNRVLQVWKQFDFQAGLNAEELEQILIEEEVVKIIDPFTVENRNGDRVIFVTKDHPFYTGCKKDFLTKTLFTVFKTRSVESLNEFRAINDKKC